MCPKKFQHQPILGCLAQFPLNKPSKKQNLQEALKFAAQFSPLFNSQFNNLVSGVVGLSLWTLGHNGDGSKNCQKGLNCDVIYEWPLT